MRKIEINKLEIIIVNENTSELRNLYLNLVRWDVTSWDVSTQIIRKRNGKASSARTKVIREEG